MIKFKENTQRVGGKDGWKDRLKDRRTNTSYFIGPFQLPPGFQRVLCENNSLTHTISLLV